METRELLIVRQTCIKAAAEITAAHPETEVAYDPDGKPIGEATVDIGNRVIQLAEQFETWALRGNGGVDLEAASKVAASSSAPDGFDIDKCPRHHKSANSKFNPEMRPLYCPEQGCEWARTDFVNTNEDTGDMTRVTKYRLTKEGKYQYPDQYMETLKAEGLL